MLNGKLPPRTRDSAVRAHTPHRRAHTAHGTHRALRARSLRSRAKTKSMPWSIRDGAAPGGALLFKMCCSNSTPPPAAIDMKML